MYLTFTTSASAQEADSLEADGATIRYGDNGFEFESSDGNFLLQFGSRLQFRYAHPGDTDPATEEDFLDEPHQTFKVNRARLKIGGHAFRPWLKYYSTTTGKE